MCRRREEAGGGGRRREEGGGGRRRRKCTTKNKVRPPVKTRALFNSSFSDVLQDMWHSCPKVFAIVVSVLPAVSPLPKTLHER